jgi:hypothetical protein
MKQANTRKTKQEQDIQAPALVPAPPTMPNPAILLTAAQLAIRLSVANELGARENAPARP